MNPNQEILDKVLKASALMPDLGFRFRAGGGYLFVLDPRDWPAPPTIMVSGSIDIEHGKIALLNGMEKITRMLSSNLFTSFKKRAPTHSRWGGGINVHDTLYAFSQGTERFKGSEEADEAIALNYAIYTASSISPDNWIKGLEGIMEMRCPHNPFVMEIAYQYRKLS